MNTTFKIDWGEIKTGQYGTTFKGTFIRPDGSKFDATISEKDKNGVEFPNFAQIAPGTSVIGVEWTGAKGTYIFAPKPASTGNTGGSRGGANMTKVMEKKNENIRDAQDRKDIAIRLSGSMTSAVQLALAEVGPNADPKRMEMAILRWRNWLLDNHGSEKDVIDPTK